MDNIQNENGHVGEDAAILDVSAVGADTTDYTHKKDCWGSNDHHRMCTDLTDFLQFFIERYGIRDSSLLVKAVNQIKLCSERLAFCKETDHE